MTRAILASIVSDGVPDRCPRPAHCVRKTLRCLLGGLLPRRRLTPNGDAGRCSQRAHRGYRLRSEREQEESQGSRPSHRVLRGRFSQREKRRLLLSAVL